MKGYCGLIDKKNIEELPAGASYYINSEISPPTGSPVQTILDLTGNGYLSTLKGGVSYNATTKALDFDGVNGIIETDLTYSMPLGTENFTVFCTMKTTQVGAGGLVVIYGVYPIPFWLGMRNTGKVFFWTRKTNRQATINYSSNSVADGSKYVICYRKSGTTFSVFVDGVLNSTTTLSNGAINTSKTMDIGARQNGVQHYDGSIYNVLKYPIDLTDAEIVSASNILN